MKSLLLLSLLTLVSCKSAWEKAYEKRDNTTVTFEKALEAKTGNAYKRLKMTSEDPDYAVYQNQNTGEIVAYNVTLWDPKTMTTLDQYNAIAREGTDIVHNLTSNKEWQTSGYYRDLTRQETQYNQTYNTTCSCYETKAELVTVVYGQEWVDTSGYYYYYTSGSFRFENTGGLSKDLETLAALKEEAKEAYMAHAFKSQFSLSDDRSAQLAKTVSRYQRLENSRELTQAENNKFALDTLGVSMGQLERALKDKAQGSEAAYDDLLKTAATVNKTTPEMIGKFFDMMANP